VGRGIDRGKVARLGRPASCEGRGRRRGEAGSPVSGGERERERSRESGSREMRRPSVAQGMDLIQAALNRIALVNANIIARPKQL
jgi:hypothetical protein